MIFPLLGKGHIVSHTHTKKKIVKRLWATVPMFVPNVFITI